MSSLELSTFPAQERDLAPPNVDDFKPLNEQIKQQREHIEELGKLNTSLEEKLSSLFCVNGGNRIPYSINELMCWL